MSHQVRRILPFMWFLLLSLCLWQLASVGMADETPSPPALAATPQYTNEELLTQMLVVDVSERTLDTSPALAVTFSQELDPTADYNAFITLTAGGKMVEGSWVMANETTPPVFQQYQATNRVSGTNPAGCYQQEWSGTAKAV